MLFTKEFLDSLQEKCGAQTMIDHYMNDENMSFHDAILRFANFHSMEPEYALKGYSRPASVEVLAYIESIRNKNGTSATSRTA